MDYAFVIKKLEKENASLNLQLKEALIMLDEKDKKIEELENRLAQIENLLSQQTKKTVKKNSKNSNLPPSKDINKPNRNSSLRNKSNKKTGGQPGHKGHFLQMSDNPNKVIPIIPKACINCGLHLDDSLKTLVSSKQEIDIPPIQPIVYQYDSYAIQCQCGHCNQGQFPQRLKANVQYGPNIRSLINYFSVYQYLPYKRLKILFKDVFNLDFSQGTIFNALKRSALKSFGIYSTLKIILQQSNVVGADETPIVVNGVKFYNWVWQNTKITFIACENSRKKDNIYKHFNDGFPNAILISDRYAAHLSTPSKGYQICWSHLMRHLNYLIETENNPWIHQLIRIYRKAKKLEKIKPKWNNDNKQIIDIEAQLNQLLIQKIDNKLFKNTAILHKSLNINRYGILTFLYHEDVPSHNNASEQAIRNAKVKMKISGQFKSGQNFYAIMRSIIDTLIKNNKPILQSLLKIEKGEELSFGF